MNTYYIRSLRVMYITILIYSKFCVTPERVALLFQVKKDTAKSYIEEAHTMIDSDGHLNFKWGEDFDEHGLPLSYEKHNPFPIGQLY